MNIESFSGEFRFLSNFWPASVELDGDLYPSTEHAYQAAKTLDKGLRSKIRQADSPGKAKRLGGKLKLREDWETVKLGVMENILRQKFSEPLLKMKLQNTAPKELIEGNHWNDTFWGICNGEGSNHLGKLLMKIRDE